MGLVAHTRLGEMLVETGGLSPVQLEEALKAQLIYGGKLGTILIELGFVSQAFLTSALAQQTGLPPAPIEELESASKEALAAISKDLAEKYTVIPFRLEKRRIHIAISDPANLAVVDEVSFATGLNCQAYVAPELLLWSFLERYYEVARPDRYIRLSEDPAIMSTVGQAKPNAMGSANFGSAAQASLGPMLTEEPAPIPPDAAPLAAEEDPNAPLDLKTAIKRLARVDDRDEVLSIILRFGSGYFENVGVFVLRADGYRLHVAKGSQAFELKAYSLVDSVPKTAFGDCLGPQGFQEGVLPPGAPGLELIDRLGLSPLEPVFMITMQMNQRPSLIVFGGGPRRPFTDDDLRIFRLFVDKASLAVQILVLTQRLLVLPADFA